MFYVFDSGEVYSKYCSHFDKDNVLYDENGFADDSDDNDNVNKGDEEDEDDEETESDIEIMKNNNNNNNNDNEITSVRTRNNKRTRSEAEEESNIFYEFDKSHMPHDISSFIDEIINGLIKISICRECEDIFHVNDKGEADAMTICTTAGCNETYCSNCKDIDTFKEQTCLSCNKTGIFIEVGRCLNSWYNMVENHSNKKLKIDHYPPNYNHNNNNNNNDNDDDDIDKLIQLFDAKWNKREFIVINLPKEMKKWNSNLTKDNAGREIESFLLNSKFHPFFYPLHHEELINMYFQVHSKFSFIFYKLFFFLHVLQVFFFLCFTSCFCINSFTV